MNRSLLPWIAGAAALALAACSPPPAPEPYRPPAGTGATVALLTDFGLQDDAVGLMRGVILEIAPGASVVDLCHEVRRFDAGDGGRLLAEAPAVYPPGSILCVVVDPGVGSARREIVARLPNGTMIVAPDNGVITDAVERHGPAEVRAVVDRSFFREGVSATFHGRDRFAPAAAHLAAGRSFEQAGPLVDDWIKLERPQPRVVGRELIGQIEAIDEPFGNVWTNLPADWLRDLGLAAGASLELELGELQLTVPLCRTFSDVPQDQPLAYVNSRGRIALALNQADFARAHAVERGQTILLRPSE